MYNNFVLLQGRLEIVSSQPVSVANEMHGKKIDRDQGGSEWQIDGFVHTAQAVQGGRHRIRLMGQSAQWVKTWLDRYGGMTWPEVIVEGKQFTPPNESGYMLVEHVRIIGSGDSASRSQAPPLAGG